MVQEKITGGRALITMGAGESPEASLVEARDLAAVLNAGPLQAELELIEARSICLPAEGATKP